VRYYGREDFVHRLKETGFEVEELKYGNRFSAAERDRYGIDDQEIIFVCRKK